MKKLGVAFAAITFAFFMQVEASSGPPGSIAGLVRDVITDQPWHG